MPQAEFWGAVAPTFPPPAGLQARCPRCGTPLRTSDNEPVWKGIVHADGPSRWPGWNLPCICGYQEVFFRMPDRYSPPAQALRSTGTTPVMRVFLEVAQRHNVRFPPGFLEELEQRLRG